MSATTVDELQVLVTANTKQIQQAFREIAGRLDDVESSTGKFSNKSAALFGVVAGAAQALAQKGIDVITSSIGGAVSRVDTLNNAQNVFRNLGFSVQETKKTMDALDKSIDGLPTTLDSAVRGVQNLAASTGSLSGAQKIYAAINDGVLAMGGSAQDSESAVLQLSKAFAKGTIDGQTFNSLIDSNLGPVLNKLAEQLNIDPSDFQSALSKGKISAKDFGDALVRLDTTGIGSFASLHKQAQDATRGIGTSFTNALTAVKKSLGDMLDAIGRDNISGVFDKMKKAIKDAGAEAVKIINFVKANSGVFGTLAAAIGGATAAIVAYNAVAKLYAIYTAAMSAASTYMTLVASLQAQGLGLLRAAWMALNITMAANPIGIVITLVAALVAGLAYFFTQTDTGKKIFKTAMDAIKKAAQAAWDWIKSNWPLLLAILTGPIGLAVAEIIKHWDTVKNTFLAAWNYIKSVWSAATGFFSGVWNGIQRAFSAVTGWFGSTFRSAWSAVANAFSGVTGFFVGIKNKIVSAFSGIGRSISSFFHNIWDGVGADLKSAINAVLHLPLTIPKIHIPHVGTVGGQTLIPRLAKGGVIDSATLALVGESGKEAVMPLENNTGWIDELAGKLNSKSGGQPTQIIVKIGEDTILDKMIDGINGKSFLNGASVLNI